MQNEQAITILRAFGDNYIYLLEHALGQCFAVDPGEPSPVLKAVCKQNLELTHLLLTHHHLDHIDGVSQLKKETGCQVIGPDAQRIGEINVPVCDGDTLELGEVHIRCIATPGHTATSVCYYVTGSRLSVPVLFTGDTLFVFGCGRVLECDGETMYASLQKLASLPDEALVYPGHDYTEENVRFALTLRPDYEELHQKLKYIHKLENSGKPTVPSVLKEEKALNPFLRAESPETFTTLRRKKDVY